MNFSWRRLSKWSLNLFCVFIIFFTVFNLTHTLTDMAMEQNQGWEINAKTQAQLLTQRLNADGYCILAPRTGRAKLVFGDFYSIDIRTVINNELKRRIPIRHKLLGKEFDELEIRDAHFGILVNKEFYYWSFTEQRFFDGQSHGYNGTFYINEMSQRINTLFDPTKTPEQQAQAIGKHLGYNQQFNPNPKLTDSICPEYLPKDIPDYEIIPYRPHRRVQFKAISNR